MKDLGYTWCTGEDLVNEMTDDKYLYYREAYDGICWCTLGLEGYKNLAPNYTEITPVFSEREVTITETYVSGFEVVGNSDKAKVEELVEKLQKQLEEAQQELSKLK